jgi:NitT/TauT family transport system substrate-binding protein
MHDSASQQSPYAFEVYKTPDLAAAKLISGEMDMAGLPTNIAAILYNKGAEVQIAAVIGWGVLYVVSSDLSLKNWSGLKGKEVCVPSKGALSDILFRYLLSQNNLDPERDLKILYLASPIEAAQLAAAGKINLAALPEPWVTELLEKNPGFKVALDFQKEWRRIEKQGLFYPQTAMVVRKRFAQEQPAALRRFLKELEQSMQWLSRHPQAGGLLAEKYIQISPPAVEKGLSSSNLKYRSAAKVRNEVTRFLQRLLEFAPESIGGKLPDEGFYAQP